MAAIRYGPFERALIFVHRWVGIAIALLMALWAVSGVVMLYVAFPELTDDERYAGMEPLDFDGCCAASAAESLEGFSRISISMLAGRPVARAGSGFDEVALDLVSGEWLAEVSPALARSVAVSHLGARGLDDGLATSVEIHNDQWTVYSRFAVHRPLHKVAFDNARGDVIYVSGRTGEVVQDTHRRERFWNWLGAVPHWLYFRAFREHQGLWYQSVVYASVLGTLLAASGLYLGIRRTLAAGGRWTRYLGPMRWHHLTGLVFGVLTLTWVVSGLLSMNPWGWLESSGAAAERARVAINPLTAADIAATLRAARDPQRLPVASLDVVATGSEPVVIAATNAGERLRREFASLRPKPLSEPEIAARLQQMRPDAGIGSLQLLHSEDAYYFGHKSTPALPVYRAILSDPEATRYYFDVGSGEVVHRVDAAGRWYRWLHYGLHRFDFGAVLRSRPLWDAVILPLLAGVSALCLIGCWIGYRRLRYRLRSR